MMSDPTEDSITNIVNDLNLALAEESKEQLTELELEELMEALDCPSL